MNYHRMNMNLNIAETLKVPPILGSYGKDVDVVGGLITGLFALLVGTTLQENRPYWVYASMDYPVIRIGILFLIFLLAWNDLYVTAIFLGISYAMILDDVSKIASIKSSS
jgi:hypothetical protein